LNHTSLVTAPVYATVDIALQSAHGSGYPLDSLLLEARGTKNCRRDMRKLCQSCVRAERT
jgi:hypothetical protein